MFSIDTNYWPYIYENVWVKTDSKNIRIFHADILLEGFHRDNQIQCLLSTYTLQWLLITLGKFNKPQTSGKSLQSNLDV